MRLRSSAGSDSTVVTSRCAAAVVFALVQLVALVAGGGETARSTGPSSP